MRFRLPRILLLSAAVVVAATGSAMAATSQQVIRDAADGVIDGKYTAAELRAADREINPQEREYYLWDEAYADALRRLNNPDAAPLPVVPVKDFDGDGKIEASDVQEAREQTQKLRAKVRKQNPKDFEVSDDEEVIAPEDDGDEDEAEAVVAKGDDDGSGGSGWLTALLFAIPAAIIALGTWRMQRSRRKAAKALGGAAPAVAGHKRPRGRKARKRARTNFDLGTTSTFATGDDLR